MPREKSLIGKKISMLTVLKSIRKSNGHYYLLCKCDCGCTKEIRRDGITAGKVKSCGCFLKSGVSNFGKSITHGMSKEPFWVIWRSIKDRCQNKNSSGFKKYGARGIKVCNSWQKFETFKIDMYESYLFHIKKFGKKNTTIERINNNGNYCKENCRWATIKEQARNRRNNHFIQYGNQRKTIAEWSEKTGVSQNNIYDRLKRNWTIEEIFTIPVRKQKQRLL